MGSIDRAAEIIGSALTDDADASIAGNYSDTAVVSEAILDGKYNLTAVARALSTAGLLAPDLPEPIINADDGNPEWHADEYTVDVDWGMVNLWTPDGTHWEQTPSQARNLVIALLAAADYAESENRHAQDD